jgi:hypothetical protein
MLQLLHFDTNAVAEEKLLQRSFIDATDVEEVHPLVLLQMLALTSVY